MLRTSRIISIILWVIIAISAVLVITMMSNISNNPTDPVMGKWIGNNITWSIILLIIGAAIALLFAVFNMFTDWKSAKKGLLSLGVIALVAFVAYSLASDAIPQFVGVEKYVADGTLTPRVSKLVDTGLIATYILFGVAILALIWSSVSQVFK